MVVLLKNEDHAFTKTRFLPQNTVKFNCPAKIRLSEIIVYPDYTVRVNFVGMA